MGPDELLALLQGKHLDDRLRLEQRAAQRAGTEVRAAALDEAAQDVARAWILEAGGPRTRLEDPAALARITALVRSKIVSALGGLGSGAAAGVRAVLASARSLGVDQAVQAWRGQGGGRVPGGGLGGRPDGRAAGALSRAVSAAQRDVLRLVNPTLIKRLGLTAALVPVRRAKGVLDLVNAAVTRMVGQAMSEGATAVAHAVDAPFEVWIAERDACARCQAYSGHVVAAGAPFPGGMSMDPAQARPKAEPVTPPLHPHCRCKPVPYDPGNHPPGEVTLPEAARREALRSAVRGFSLPTESNASRLRVAKHALSQLQPGDLPKSVVAYGRSAVRQGKFPSGRDVPTGAPAP